MSDDASDIPVYEITASSLRGPWAGRSFLQLLNQRRQMPSQRLSTAVLAAFLVVSIHALLLGSVILGAAHQTRYKRPDRQGAGGSAIVSAAEPVMTLILIADAGLNNNHTDETIASRGLTIPHVAITIATPNPWPAIDLSATEDQADHTTAAQENEAEAAARAALFGRYMGQIQARIERAWIRPRSAIEGDTFQCRVQIVQDAQGAVKETTLQRCNGDTRWQLSLVQAIQSASPLPAPPNPDVFADALTLEFTSRGYDAGENSEGFEPQSVMSAAAAATIPALAPWMTGQSKVQ
jgi:hypothetical protein